MLKKKGKKSRSRQNKHFNYDKILSNKKYLISFIILLVFSIICITYSFAALTPTSSIIVPSTTLSYDNKDEGSWQYTKSASWIDKSKAQINIKLDTIQNKKIDYTDVILVLDTSSSMVEDRFTKLKNEVNYFINDMASAGNKIALITFNSSANVVTSFTDDVSSLQESVNNLTATGETNYYQALMKIDDVLSTYNKQNNRDCVAVFLTDGLPAMDTPNEVGAYSYLKSKYEYLTINGIQYEFSDSILDSVKNVTDAQFIADKNNLDKVLRRASISSNIYDKLILTDYVDTDYFNLNNITNISTSYGKTTVEDGKVIWDLSGLKSGLDAKLTIDINLNNDLIGVGGVYPTHTKTDVTYEIGSTKTTESTTKTTVLKDNYTVTYEENAPSGCTVTNIPSSRNNFVHDKVQMESSVPVCKGYQFKNWEIITPDVEKVNDDTFIMPDKDVTLRATWKKLSVTKSMDGTIYKVPTLYELIASKSIGLDTNINFNEAPTSSDSGVYTRSKTENDKYPVYYYRGIINNNNVSFAGFCWKIVRTTSTGGVKLIYNGTYSNTNKCNNNRESSAIGKATFNDDQTTNTIGYMYSGKFTLSTYTSSAMNSNKYKYGNDVTWDGSKYALVDTYSGLWSSSRTELAKKYHYVCDSSSIQSSCTKVRYIITFTDDSKYSFIPLSSGQKIEDIKDSLFDTTISSTMKQTIDSWYEANMTNYTEKLEDTIYCNDKSLVSGSFIFGKDEDATENNLVFSTYNRIANLYTPTIECPNAKRDGFTVSTSSGGNGALTYPVGLLTVDEATLAGTGNGENENHYLAAEIKYSLLSPYAYSSSSEVFAIYPYGTMSSAKVTDSFYVRPSVSLAPGIMAAEGDGSITSPYIIE